MLETLGVDFIFSKKFPFDKKKKNCFAFNLLRSTYKLSLKLEFFKQAF